MHAMPAINIVSWAGGIPGRGGAIRMMPTMEAAAARAEARRQPAAR